MYNNATVAHQADLLKDIVDRETQIRRLREVLVRMCGFVCVWICVKWYVRACLTQRRCVCVYVCDFFNSAMLTDAPEKKNRNWISKKQN